MFTKAEFMIILYYMNREKRNFQDLERLVIEFMESKRVNEGEALLM